jgi:cytosine/adenosine deaminase-related metal-dependent hydrolase
VRLVTADWVLPVSGPPIPGGAVLTEGDRVVRVGDAAELERETPAADLTDLPGCTVIPGLVNAHTHLALTVFDGLLAPDELPDWMGRLVGGIRVLSPDDLGASAAWGAARCLAGGATTVGDIAYGVESMAAASELGLGGVFFWELLGLAASQLDERLAETGFPGVGDGQTEATGPDPAERPSEPQSTTARPGVSPHTVYSSGPELIRAARRFADERGLPFCMHVAESQAEDDLMQRGEGPFARLAERLADGFVVPHASPVAYLDGLGVLERAVVVHGVQLDAADIAILAERSAGIVLCPRSNAFLRGSPAPAAALAGAGVALAVGTDSVASNVDLDLFEEGRAVRRIHPGLDARATLELMTAGGADVLGLGDARGRLAPGSRADLCAVRIGPVDRPEEALVEEAVATSVEAVMAGGEWRVLGGGPLFETDRIERRAALVRENARRALETGESDLSG